MTSACANGDSAACQNAIVTAINHKHALEGAKPMQLPSNYSQLPKDQQLLVLANQERQTRGLPTISSLSPDLNTMAMQGAKANTDPSGPANRAWGANWAGGEASALEADYDWMYNDGQGGDNIDCTNPNAPGCWGHRDNILGNYGAQPTMGAADTSVNGSDSMTQVFASS